MYLWYINKDILWHYQYILQISYRCLESRFFVLVWTKPNTKTKPNLETKPLYLAPFQSLGHVHRAEGFPNSPTKKKCKKSDGRSFIKFVVKFLCVMHTSLRKNIWTKMTKFYSTKFLRQWCIKLKTSYHYGCQTLPEWMLKPNLYISSNLYDMILFIQIFSL